MTNPVDFWRRTLTKASIPVSLSSVAGEFPITGANCSELDWAAREPRSGRMTSSAKFKRCFLERTNVVLKLKAEQLLYFWLKCDSDGNGFIEGLELDDFLREFVASVCQSDVGTEVVSETMLRELKKDFMDAYDENGDGKIEIRELAQLLPTDENFLLLFQLDNRINSSIDFMKIWKTYDKDSSGYIEANELKWFLKDLLSKSKSPKPLKEEKLEEYVSAILALFDENKDGKLQLSEMSRLLPVKENALSAVITKNFLEGSKTVGYASIEQIFSAYDKDKNGVLEGDEISGFVKDLLELMKPSYTTDDLRNFQHLLMKSCDLDGDGKICREELTMMILGIQKYRK